MSKSELRSLRCPCELCTPTLEEVKDKWFTALQSDLEHGVAWMNEEASREFAKRYPMISAFSEWLNNEER